jgi:thiol:disulfide interchange protein DsbD
LSQEQAFPFFVSEAGTNTLRVTWQSAPEHYLYKRAFKFSYYSSATAAAQDVAFSIPQGLAKTDEFFGEVEVYFDQLEVELDLPQSPSTDGFLIIEYQGCADWGFCYPPQRTRFEL